MPTQRHASQLLNFSPRINDPHSHNVEELFLWPNGTHRFGLRNFKSVKCFHKFTGFDGRLHGCAKVERFALPPSLTHARTFRRHRWLAKHLFPVKSRSAPWPADALSLFSGQKRRWVCRNFRQQLHHFATCLGRLENFAVRQVGTLGCVPRGRNWRTLQRSALKASNRDKSSGGSQPQGRQRGNPRRPQPCRQCPHWPNTLGSPLRQGASMCCGVCCCVGKARILRHVLVKMENIDSARTHRER